MALLVMQTTTDRSRQRVAMPRSSFVVPAIAALGSAIFFAWKPGVAVSAVASPRAFAFTAAVGVLTIVLGWLLPRLGRGFLLTAAAQSVPVVLAFVVTVLPALRTVTVNDPLPSPVNATAAVPGAAANPVTVSQAALKGIHHRASGTAALITLADGSRVVRLARLDVEPGPDYFVVLVPGADRSDPDGGTRLSRLRGSRGNQNYPIPAGLAVQRPVTVLIWCRAFAVPVAAATLR
jgi:hypothetical protein